MLLERMGELISCSREVSLQRLPLFLKSLLAGLISGGLTEEQARDAVRDFVLAECLQCKVAVKGEELLDVISDPAPQAVSPKAERLRQGYCARSQCPSYFLQLSFRSMPGVDWKKIVAQSEQMDGEQRQETTLNEEADRRAAHLRNRRLRLIRIAAGVVIILILLLIRQWYTGRRIPLLQPKGNFQADPASIYDRPPDR
jgi:hypothetical protein